MLKLQAVAQKTDKMYFFQFDIAQMWLKQWIKFTLSNDRIINQCDAIMQTQI